jgi:hypothetical protein
MATLSNLAKYMKIEVERRKSFHFRVNMLTDARSKVHNNGRKEIDLTGYKMLFTLKTAESDNNDYDDNNIVVHKYADIPEPLEGYGEFMFEAAELDSPVGEYFYTVTLWSPQGYSWALIDGDFILNANTESDSIHQKYRRHHVPMMTADITWVDENVVNIISNHAVGADGYRGMAMWTTPKLHTVDPNLPVPQPRNFEYLEQYTLDKSDLRHWTDRYGKEIEPQYGDLVWFEGCHGVAGVITHITRDQIELLIVIIAYRSEWQADWLQNEDSQVNFIMHKEVVMNWIDILENIFGAYNGDGPTNWNIYMNSSLRWIEWILGQTPKNGAPISNPQGDGTASNGNFDDGTEGFTNAEDAWNHYINTLKITFTSYPTVNTSLTSAPSTSIADLGNDWVMGHKDNGIAWNVQNVAICLRENVKWLINQLKITFTTTPENSTKLDHTPNPPEGSDEVQGTGGWTTPWSVLDTLRSQRDNIVYLFRKFHDLGLNNNTTPTAGNQGLVRRCKTSSGWELLTSRFKVDTGDRAFNYNSTGTRAGYWKTTTKTNRFLIVNNDGKEEQSKYNPEDLDILFDSDTITRAFKASFTYLSTHEAQHENKYVMAHGRGKQGWQSQECWSNEMWFHGTFLPPPITQEKLITAKMLCERLHSQYDNTLHGATRWADGSKHTIGGIQNVWCVKDVTGDSDKNLIDGTLDEELIGIGNPTGSLLGVSGWDGVTHTDWNGDMSKLIINPTGSLKKQKYLTKRGTSTYKNQGGLLVNSNDITGGTVHVWDGGDKGVQYDVKEVGVGPYSFAVCLDGVGVMFPTGCGAIESGSVFQISVNIDFKTQ